MKTNLFFVAALLFAGSAMSQSVNGSSQASSNFNATVPSKQKDVSSNTALSSQTAVNTGSKADQSISARSSAESGAKVNAGHNKGGANSSINIGEDVSAKSTVHATSNGLNHTEAAAGKTAKASVNTAKNVKAKAEGAPLRPRVAARVTSRSVVSIR